MHFKGVKTILPFGHLKKWKILGFKKELFFSRHGHDQRPFFFKHWLNGQAA